jgi:dephospho-CoA kinase
MSVGHVVGIVGGVGVGKSTVLGILKDKYGAMVIEADAVGHDLMKKGEKLYREEVACFGEEILDASGEIDRKKLGAMVFSDKDKLRTLNEMAHPAIREEIARRLEAWRTDGAGMAGMTGMTNVTGMTGMTGMAGVTGSTHGCASGACSDAGAGIPGGKARAEHRRRAATGTGVGIRLAVLEAALPEEAGMMVFCGRIWAVTAPLEIRIQRLMASRGYTREKCLGIIASQRGEKEFEEMAAAVIDNGGGREETERQLDRLVRDLLTA